MNNFPFQSKLRKNYKWFEKLKNYTQQGLIVDASIFNEKGFVIFKQEKYIMLLIVIFLQRREAFEGHPSDALNMF